MITKGELIEFIKSYEIYRVNDIILRNSLGELGEILERYFLFGKPHTYLLKDWEYESCLRMKSTENIFTEYELCDLEPYFLSYKRETKLKELL
jgi:hypothetical protein